MGQNGREDGVDTRRKRTPVFRATSPLSRGQLKSKGHGKLSIHYFADLEKIETVFRISTSVNQLSLCGAVAEMCEEYESFHDRTGNPLWEGSRVPHSCWVWSRQKYLWKVMTVLTKIFYCRNTENELKSYHNKTNWANFVRMQDSWMLLKSDSIAWRKILQNSHNSQMQWPVVSTIRGNTKIGPVLEVATCCLHGKYGVEIRIMSMNKDISHSWVRISHGSNKLVTNLNNNEQETSEMQFEDNALKSDARALASRSKAKAKPQKRDSAGSSTRTIPIGETTRLFAHRLFSVEGTELINLLRHGGLPREKWWSNWTLENQRQSPRTFLVLSSLVWRRVEEKHGKRRKQEKIPVLFWFIRSNLVPPSSSMPFRTQSHWSYFTRQGCYSERFLRVHLSCRMCNQLHFSSSIRDWYLEVKIWATDRQYSFCLWIPWTKTIRILTRSTWKHRVMHNTCIKHGRNIRTRYIGPTSTLLRRKDWSSIRHDRTPSFFTKRSQLIAFRKLLGWKLEKSCFRESICVTLATSKDFLETWLDERTGFRSCSTTRGRSCSTIQKFPIKPTKSKPRSG